MKDESMVFMQFLMIFICLSSSFVMQSSERKDDNFDIEAQCFVAQCQDSARAHGGFQEDEKIDNGLGAIRAFVATQAFEQYSFQAQHNQVVIPSVKKRTDLWQSIMNEVKAEKEAKEEALYRQMYFEKRDHAESKLASYGMCLESDSDDEFVLESKDLDIIQENHFLERFLSLFNENVTKFYDQVSRDVLEDMNV